MWERMLNVLREGFFFLKMIEKVFEANTDSVEMQGREKSYSKCQVWARRLCQQEESRKY